jgi:hypothetical protein
MCRRNGRGIRKIVAAIQGNHVRLEFQSPLEAGDGDEYGKLGGWANRLCLPSRFQGNQI